MKPIGNESETSQGSLLIKNKRLLLILGITAVILAVAAAAVFLWPGIARKGDPAAVENDITPAPTSHASLKTIQIQRPAESMGYELKKPFELIPEDSDETGTAADSGYRILLDKYEYTAQELTNKISIFPQTGFTVKESAKGEFLLTPVSLLPNQVYSISFSDEEEGISYSWAFQTRKEFFVTGTLPRDMATYIPVNTGIEITFSQKISSDLSEYFEINPKAEGRFEIHKNTVAFVPSSGLEYDTVYTVTVKKGLPNKPDGMTLQGDTVFAFQTEPVPTEKSDGYSCDSFEFARRLYNFYPYEAPLLSVYTNIESGTPVDFSLYRYNSEEDFRDDIYRKDDRPFWCVHYDEPIDYEGKELVLQMSTSFLSESDGDDYYFRTKFVQLPETLPEGHYIVVIKKDDMERRAFIQINELAVYIGAADNKTLAVVYKSETAEPVEGVQIVFDDFSMATDRDGFAVMEIPLFDEEGSRVKNYAIKREGHPGYYANIGESYYSSDYYYDYGYDDYYAYSDNFYAGNIGDLYWGYLFTDRDMYLPSDRINVWGMVAGKDGSTPPGKVRIILSRGYSWYYSSDEYAVIDEKEALLTGMNTFKSDISFTNLSPGSYVLEVVSGDRTLLSKSISISKYIKPLYTISSSVSQKNILPGDEVEFAMETKFFEGTPVNGMNFDYYAWGINDKEITGALTTDENGSAKLNFKVTAQSTQSWWPQHAYIRATNADPEETTVIAYESITVFPRDMMLKVSSKTDGNRICKVDIATNKIDIEGIRNKEWYTQEDYTSDPADVEITVDLFETWYTRTQTGTYYDFITKLTYPTYSYEQHEKKINTLSVNTVGGKGSFTFEKEDEKGYHAVLRCVDGKGRSITQTEYLYNYYPSDNGRDSKRYMLGSDKIYYSVNDEAKLSLYCNDEPVAREENKKVLFMLYRKGLLDYTFTDEPDYTVTFRESLIPNVGVMAVYFDGKNFNASGMKQLYYNKEDRKLNVQVTPSQQQYRPGDMAVFDVEVTDASGRGCKAEVLLSIVDESYFALWDQSADILYSIYSQNVSLGYDAASIPHTNTLDDYDYYGGAECGEGGDEGYGDVRSDFKDTAMFETVTTDENGRGQISVKLPDNLTKWRITYLGITEDLYAGSGTVNVDVRLPYFINTVFHDVFITGDKPYLQIRSFGTEIQEGEQVDYTISVEKDGEPWNSYSISSVIGERALVELDALEEGKYTYTVTGKYKSYADAIQLPFEVLPGYIEQSLTEYQALTENSTFPESKWPARVYFFNENVREYWDELLDLAYSWNNRIDSIIVRKQAKQILREYFKDTWITDDEEYDVAQYQLSNGGIALLPYDSAYPVLTAKICALNDSGFDYELMREYFRRSLESENSTSTDIAASYWGLACLHEPVLLELNELLQSQELKLIDRLYIALAYAYIGDLDTAGRMYQDIIRLYMKEDTLRAYITIEEEGYDSDDIQEATSLCALLAQKVNDAERDKLFKFVCNMYSTDILTSAMRLTAIRSNLKNLSMESAFTWELDGKKETVTLKGRETRSMFLTADKLKNIRFSDVEGKITVACVYTAPLGEISQTDERISIKRTYFDRSGAEKTTFAPSEYVRVRLVISFEPTAPSGNYMVEDYLPASLRHVYRGETGMRSDLDARWYPHEIFGQKVSFCVYHNNKDNRSIIIEYFARVYNIGEYTTDCAAVYNLESNMINYTPRTRITVEKQ